MSGEEEQKKNTEHEKELKRYEQQIEAAFTKSNDQYDRNTLVLASGALGLSFAFIDKVIGDLSEAVDPGYLALAWALIASSIISSLLSHWLSMRGNSAMLKKLKQRKRGEERKKVMRRWGRAIEIVNAGTGLLLGAGILTLVYFVHCNATQ